MSKGKATLSAYAVAENRLLELLSPPTLPQQPEVHPDENVDDDEEELELEKDLHSHLDPAVDNLLPMISDNSEIQSLISDTDSFKGFTDLANDNIGGGPSFNGPLIFGLCRGQNGLDEGIPKPAACSSSDILLMHHESPEAIRNVVNVAPQDYGMSISSFVVNTPVNQCNYDDALNAMLTNGDHHHHHHHHMGETIEIVEESQPVVELEETSGECIIYDTVDNENVVVLTDEQCCEIIVTSHGVARDQGTARAYLMSDTDTLLQLLPPEAEHQLNENGFITTTITEEVVDDEEEEDGTTNVTSANNVYLSDAAALEQQEPQLFVVQDDNNEDDDDDDDVYEEGCQEEVGQSPESLNKSHLECYVQEQCVVTDDVVVVAAHENANFVEDATAAQEEDIRPEICDTYGVVEEEQQLIINQEKPADVEQELPLESPIIIASDIESSCTPPPPQLEQQQEEQEQLLQQQQQQQQQPVVSHVLQRQSKTNKNQCNRSSTTEFPVSSTSRPNCTDYDEYDDEERVSPTPPIHNMEQPLQQQRKYPSLLKNTLVGEAQDRKLANICQTQPQMSLGEKIANWNYSHDCESVEDVEKFEDSFVKREAALRRNSSSNQHRAEYNFGYFRRMLSSTFSDRSKANRRLTGDDDDADADAVEGSNSNRVRNQCLKQQTVQQAAATTPPILLNNDEPIVLLDDDDDDDEDDCVEVLANQQQQHKRNSSTTTLTPPADELRRGAAQQQHQHQQVTVIDATINEKTTQTKIRRLLHKRKSTESKETSTLDLVDGLMLPPSRSVPDQDIAKHQLVLDAILEQQGDHRNASSPPGDLFYEQHEFCNYLGLTELATANAVATAMRELANSTVARRSLRVRTQQQMDRMRSGVSSRRRERQQQRQSQQATNETMTNSEPSTSSPVKENHQHMAIPIALEIPADTKPTDCLMYQLSPRKDAAEQQHIEFYYREQQPPQQRVELELELEKSNKAIKSWEAAFAKACTNIAPAAEIYLHEQMQQRLREARETKPSIFIVQALTPDLNKGQGGSPQQQASPPASAPAPPPSLSLSLSPPIATTSKKVRIAVTRKSLDERLTPTHERRQSTNVNTNTSKHKKSSARRRATAGGVTLQQQTQPPPSRNLVTRSTTHMNSKLLRNRKVSLLKSYALTDTAAHRGGGGGGGNKRLSGGATGAKATTLHSPKIVKTKVKKIMATQQQQQQLPHEEVENELLIVRHQPPATSAKSKRKRSTNVEGGTATAARAQVRREGKMKNVVKTKLRNRSKSYPMPMPIANIIVEPQKSQPIPEAMPQPPQAPPPILGGLIGNFSIDDRCLGGMRRTPELQQYLINQQKQQQQSPPPQPYQSPPKRKSTERNSPHKQQQQQRSLERGGTRETAGMHHHNSMPVDIRQTPPGGLLRLSAGTPSLRNPLLGKHGKVLHIYYELDQLVAVQERVISFWKFSKTFTMLQKQSETPSDATRRIFTQKVDRNDSMHTSGETERQWVPMGRLRRIINDVEIYSQFGNRLCVHNSTPVYVEMRSHALDHHKREGKLLSLYVNVYYYCEEEMRPKMHSVHLDAVCCEPNNVIYTAISESRYFIMAWQQEQAMGKSRSGLCKYSLTPTLDTLASIREFKQLRHELKHIECLTEDRLIGYGTTRVTIWDHRSGDTLMNYDLGIELGRSLGAMHLPSFDVDQSSFLILYQHMKLPHKPPELHIIACELSHSNPSSRILQIHRLPSPQFDLEIQGIDTGDHLIVTSQNGDEIWISSSDPQLLTYAAPQGTKRFYSRNKSQIIELSTESLTVDSIANHLLKLATQHHKSTLPIPTGQ